MLQLDRITLREIRLRLREPFRISSGVMDERRILLLELHDSGCSAWVVGDIAGDATVHESGAGSLRMGGVGRFDVRLSGAADIRVEGPACRFALVQAFGRPRRGNAGTMLQY